MYRLRCYNKNSFKLLQYMHLTVLRFKSEEMFLKKFKIQPLFLYRYSDDKGSETIGYMVDDTVFELFKQAESTHPVPVGGAGLSGGGSPAGSGRVWRSLLDNSNKLSSNEDIY